MRGLVLAERTPPIYCRSPFDCSFPNMLSDSHSVPVRFKYHLMFAFVEMNDHLPQFVSSRHQKILLKEYALKDQCEVLWGSIGRNGI